MVKYQKYLGKPCPSFSALFHAFLSHTQLLYFFFRLPWNSNVYIFSQNQNRMKIEALVVLLLLIPSSLALENLYEYDSLNIDLEIRGGFELIPTGGNARVEDVTAELYLIPEESFRQKIMNIDSSGESQNNKLAFTWDHPAIGTHLFGYDARVKTNNQRMEVRRKIPFPINPSELAGFEEYLQPTATIDSTNPAVVAQAAELVEGEDDLFKVAFNLANWVDTKVKYDLTTLTAETSQKASWVLENKEGVCDEMTSLFVAMARAIGIPARFVSGISYTTSDLFSEPWQPHGWAEVYFPSVGWVSFDITFGEYGYIDVTHIKLRDGFDPQDAATRYEWLAHNVELKTSKLEVNSAVSGTGHIVPEELELEQEILAPEIDLDSYNLVKGVLKNKADYYAATTLRLAVPPEVEIVGKNKRTILLAPDEVKETIWIIKVSGGLDENYIYTFPSLIWSEKNTSVGDSFIAQEGKPAYSKEEIEQLNVAVEDKIYSRKVSFTCDYPEELRQGEKAEVSCTIKNTGNTNLHQVQFCLESVCEQVDLPINQQHTSTITVEGKTIGGNKIVVTAENDLVQKTRSLPYTVLDEPQVGLSLEYPEAVKYGEEFVLKMNMGKASFNSPQNVNLKVHSFAGENSWEIEELLQNQAIGLEINSRGMGWKNKFEIMVSWQDQEGKVYSEKQEIMIKVHPASFADRMKMGINAVVNWFS